MRIRWIVPMLLAGCVWTAPRVQAEEIQLTRDELLELLDRLDRAESQISHLQGELEATRGDQPRAFPAPAPAGSVTLFDSAPPADELSQQVEALREQHESLQKSHDELSGNYEKLSEEYDSLSSSYEDFVSGVEDGQVALLRGTSNATVKFTGRIHADYWGIPHADAGAAILEGEDPQDRFGFRRIRFGFQGDIDDNMLYKFEVESTNPDDFEYRDVYVGFKHLPVFQEVLIGNQKRPYGLDHINSSRYNVFLERPFIIDLVNEDARRLGVQSWAFSEDLRWNWRYGVFLQDKTQDSDDFYRGDHYQGEVAGRLANTWWWDEGSDGRGYGHWAIAGAVARPDGDSANNTARFFARPEARMNERWIDTGDIIGAESYQVLALENVFNVGPLQLVGEALSVSLQRDGGSNLHFWGGYAYASYFLTGEHMAWDRESGQLDRIKPFENFFWVDRCCGGTGGGWGAWQVAARYSYADFTDGDVFGGVGHSTTLGLNWYWNQNARLQLNWVHGMISDQAALNAAGIADANYDIFGARMCIDF